MPKAAVRKKPTPAVQPAAPAPAPTNGTTVPPAPAPANPHGLELVYDRVGITEYSSTSAHGPMTVDDAKTALLWETEVDYQKRMHREKPDSKPEHWLFGDVFHCLDTDKRKIRCWNNANNRPFDLSWCEDLVHTILAGQWAGPLTVPGETVNGETVRISRYGRVLSGQHQLTALVLADGELQASRAQKGNAADPRYPFWNGREHPVIETVVITGLSEDERVLRTIDYVKPRTTADMLYTMELFRQNTPSERKKMTKMLASAIDLLWARTATRGYKTHPEVVGFLERHRRLLKCVEHTAVENSDKGTDGGCKISKLRLSAGHAAALCYLMGCGTEKTTEYSDEYRNESPPSESRLDWGYWDRARAFWAGLAADRGFMPVRRALGLLVDSAPASEDNQGLGGRADEKLAILAKAWEQYRDHPDGAGPAFTDDDLGPGGALCLSYNDLDDHGDKLPDGQIKLVDVADFYGIDCPGPTAGAGRTKAARRGVPEPPPPTQEEIERATEEARARRQTTKK